MDDSGQQNDEKMSHEAVHSWSHMTFFRHSAVPSLTAALLYKVSNITIKTASKLSYLVPFQHI